MMESVQPDVPATAPGCFGAPSVFSIDSQVCEACPSFDSCSTACLHTLQELRQKINVQDLLARHARATKATKAQATPVVEAKPKTDFTKFLPSVKKPPEKVERKVVHQTVQSVVDPEDQATIDRIPQAKARDLATKWCKRGLMPLIRSELQAGRNPFASQPRLSHESVVCTELLNGTVTHASLKKAFMTRLGNKEPWGESTANSHIGIAMPVLIAFGIAQETSAGWVLVPKTGCENV